MNVNKILIAVDNSQSAERAAKYGYNIAKTFAAEVALINIVEPAPPITNPDFTFAPVMVDTYDNSMENSKTLLSEMADKYANGIKTTYLSILDTASNGILQQAEEWNADLIVIGTHSRTGINHFLMGSVSEHVARKSSCPVLIVPNKADED
jgi:nucleotide-binding universal stress UspA family protein